MNDAAGRPRPGFKTQGSIDEVPKGTEFAYVLSTPFRGFRLLSPAV